MREWRVISNFMNYSVSNDGLVRNDHTDRILKMHPNQDRIINVGLRRDGVLFKRSVARLVATAFCVVPHQTFNTTIHLDGDISNNMSYNLMWRPRWFALSYSMQHREPPKGFRVPIYEITTGERFKTSWEAAVKYGLLDSEIAASVRNRTYVWPTYQRFRTQY